MLCGATCTLCLLFVYDSTVLVTRCVFLFFVASSTESSAIGFFLLMLVLVWQSPFLFRLAL